MNNHENTLWDFTTFLPLNEYYYRRKTDVWIKESKNHQILKKSKNAKVYKKNRVKLRRRVWIYSGKSNVVRWNQHQIL